MKNTREACCRKSERQFLVSWMSAWNALVVTSRRAISISPYEQSLLAMPKADAHFRFDNDIMTNLRCFQWSLHCCLRKPKHFEI